MSKTLFKRALSLTAAAFMGIMAAFSQMPPVQASAAAADISVNAAATVPAVTTTALMRWAFKFDAPKNNISVGEEMTVTLISTWTDNVWDRDELPEFTIGDPEVVSIEKGEETGTFIVKGLSEGSTFVRFIYNGYADFAVNVTDENGELVTQTNAVTTAAATVPETTTAPASTVSTTSAPSETVTSLHSIPQTTVTTAGLKLRCEPDYVQLKEGESQYIELYVGSELYSGNMPEIRVDYEDIANVSYNDTTWGFYVNGVMDGGTYAEITVDYMGEVLTAELPIDVLPKNLNTDTTGDTGTTAVSSTTATLPTTTAPLNTVPTTAPTGETVTSLHSSPQTTTTTAGIVLKCEPSYVQIKEGQSIMVELYCEPDSVPYSGEFPTVIIDDETIASTSPCDFPRGFYINGLSEGGTYAEISVDFMGEVLTTQLPIDVLPKNVNTDITDTTGTTFTTTADPFGNTVTLPNSTTAPSNTVPTTAPTSDNVTSLQSTTELTTTSTGLELRCEPDYVQVNVNTANGLNGLKRVDIYLGSELISADFVKASVEDESVAGLILSQDNNGFYVEGKAEGGTYAEFTVNYNGEELTAILPIDVLPEEPNLDVTTTLPTSTTTTPNSSTGTVPTFTTTVTTPNTTTTPNSSTGTVPTFTTNLTSVTTQGIKLSEDKITISAGQRFGLGVTLYDGSPYGGALVNAVSDNPAVAIAQYSDIPYSFYIVGISEGTAHFTVYDSVYGSIAGLDVTVTAAETEESFHGAEITIDSLPDKLTYTIGEKLDLTGGSFSTVVYESMTDPDSIQHVMDDHTKMNENNVITAAFDSTKPGKYPVIISRNHKIYGGWDVEVFYVTVLDLSSDKTGDVNNDGTVDLSDATNILNIYACMAAGMEIAFENADAADINGDGNVDTADASYILTYYAYKSAGIPCTWEDIIR